jgi:hypothetical protein
MTGVLAKAKAEVKERRKRVAGRQRFGIRMDLVAFESFETLAG